MTQRLDSSTFDLESVLAGTEKIIRGVSPEQAHLPTPCPDFDVAQLVDHVLGWAASYAARLSGREFHGVPGDHRAGPHPGDEFRQFASEIAVGYRSGSDAAEELPVGILLMDFIVHGWDLATATGQPAVYGEQETGRALAAGRQMLKPEYRGPNKNFGPEVEPEAGATPLQTLVAFLGRDPEWKPSATG